MKNLKEFKELIKRYETIQLPEIEEEYDDDQYDYKINLTGFGKRSTCTLCKAVNDDCKLCVYAANVECVDFETYRDISIAETPKQLLTAYRNRAKFMRKLLKEKGVDDGTGS